MVGFHYFDSDSDLRKSTIVVMISSQRLRSWACSLEIEAQMSWACSLEIEVQCVFSTPCFDPVWVSEDISIFDHVGISYGF